MTDLVKRLHSAGELKRRASTLLWLMHNALANGDHESYGKANAEMVGKLISDIDTNVGTEVEAEAHIEKLEARLRAAEASNLRMAEALTEIAGHGCYRTNPTAGPAQDAYDHLAACVNLACAALAASPPKPQEKANG
jgi:Predicted prefoldin, molecular chaperone implicated in de novo protein folding